MLRSANRGRHAVTKRCTDLGLTLTGDEIVDVYRALMAIADDRKIIADADVMAVIKALRNEIHDEAHHVDPFETPAAAWHAERA